MLLRILGRRLQHVDGSRYSPSHRSPGGADAAARRGTFQDTCDLFMRLVANCNSCPHLFDEVQRENSRYGRRTGADAAARGAAETS